MIKGLATGILFLMLVGISFPAAVPTAAAEEAGVQQAWAVPAQDISLAGDSDFVNLKELIPNLRVDLKYATADNITGRSIYGFDQAYLRKGPALKLQRAEAEAEQLGYRLQVWDAYRPPEAQFQLWDADPNPDYIADPYTTYSYHSRGEAVDVTLTDPQGNELDMPSGFDDSTARATRDFQNDPPAEAEHALLLQKIVQDNGLTGIPSEWWHFQDDSVRYPVAELNPLFDITLTGGSAPEGSGVPAYMVGGRALVPASSLAGLLGLSLQWNAATGQITLASHGASLVMQPGSTRALLNGTVVSLAAVPRIVVATAYVPLRLVSDLFGYSLTWDESARTAAIR